MPLFDSTSMIQQTLSGSAYGFSGTRIEDLGAAEYTLVTIVCDDSGSVNGFRKELEACIEHIIHACQRSPRADNLMLRLVRFDSSLYEVHGFKPLQECHPAEYSGFLQSGGTTALYDACVNSVSAMNVYGRDLENHGFAANGIVFVLTDGEDNASTATVAMVGDTLKEAVCGEYLEGMTSVLVGVNVSGSCSKSLMAFSGKAGFSQYIELDHADANTLSGLADFASRSVVAQSRMLGTGHSVSLRF